MAKERRVKRLEQLILEIVAETIQRELRDPRIGMVSVTRIRLAPDLTTATVFWSTLEDERRRARVATALEGALPLIQRRVAENLSTRVTPALSLRFDATLERAQRLDEIFHRLAEERGEPAPEAPAEGEASDAPAEDRDAGEEGESHEPGDPGEARASG